MFIVRHRLHQMSDLRERKMFDFLNLYTVASLPTLPLMIYTVLVAFLLSSLIGVTYTKTFRGLSYSRNYVQAVILGSIVAATVGIWYGLSQLFQ